MDDIHGEVVDSVRSSAASYWSLQPLRCPHLPHAFLPFPPCPKQLCSALTPDILVFGPHLQLEQLWVQESHVHLCIHIAMVPIRSCKAVSVKPYQEKQDNVSHCFCVCVCVCARAHVCVHVCACTCTEYKLIRADLFTFTIVHIHN